MNTLDAIAQMNIEVYECYLEGRPVRLNFNRHSPEFMMTRVTEDELQAAHYVCGAPVLIGSHSLRNIVTIAPSAEDILYPAVIFDGTGRFSTYTFGSRISTGVLNSLAQFLEIPHVFD